MRTAIEGGIADAWGEFDAFKKDQIESGKIGSAQFFGTADDLKGNYLYRMAGAAPRHLRQHRRGSVFIPGSPNDAGGAPLTGANNYTFRFPVRAAVPGERVLVADHVRVPASQLVPNPIKRYLINSPMLPSLVADPDGGYTFYIQNLSPGVDREAELAARLPRGRSCWCCGCTGPSPTP